MIYLENRYFLPNLIANDVVFNLYIFSLQCLMHLMHSIGQLKIKRTFQKERDLVNKEIGRLLHS